MTLIEKVQHALDLVADVYGTEPRTAIAAGSEIIIVHAYSGEVVGLIRNADKPNHARIVNRLIDSMTGAV